MARKRDRKSIDGCALDMTPMIDVVFQLIIFFVVTITMSEAKDESIRLELAPNGEEVQSSNDSPEALTSLTIDVNKYGDISVSSIPIDETKLKNIMQERKKRFGDNFEVWIRGDAIATHNQIRKAMDVCTACGIGKVSFLAVKDPRTGEQKDFFDGIIDSNEPEKVKHVRKYKENQNRLQKRR